MNIDISDIGLETTIKNGISMDMSMRDICRGSVSLYSLLNPESSLFKIQIPQVGKKRLHVAYETVNSFVLKRFGRGIKNLSNLLY